MTARASPDVYPLMIAYVATHGTNPAVKKSAYNAVTGFTPVGMIGGTPNLLVVTPRVPVSNLRELVAYAQANPSKLDYGTSGKGTLNHPLMEQFKHAAKFESLSLPYKSIGQAFTDLMSGQVQAIFPGLAAAMLHVKSGAVKPMAVTGLARHPLLPNVPTFKESGYEGFEGLTWYGIAGPAKLPQSIVKKLNEEINKILALPDLREKLAGQALDVMPMTPEQYGRYIADEIAHWTRVARAGWQGALRDRPCQSVSAPVHRPCARCIDGRLSTRGAARSFSRRCTRPNVTCCIGRKVSRQLRIWWLEWGAD